MMSPWFSLRPGTDRQGAVDRAVDVQGLLVLRAGKPGRRYSKGVAVKKSRVRGPCALRASQLNLLPERTEAGTPGDPQLRAGEISGGKATEYIYRLLLPRSS